MRGCYQNILKHQVAEQLHWHMRMRFAGTSACNGSITALKIAVKYVPLKTVFIAAAC